MSSSSSTIGALIVTFKFGYSNFAAHFYFGERMKTTSAGEKVKKREERQNFVQKLCVHTVNGQTNKH